MKTGAFHSSGRLDVQMLIGRFRLQRFVFLADGEPFDITNFTWQLNIKQNVGQQMPWLTLSTAGNGLSFPVYEENVLEARFEADQVKVPTIQEGKAYWELLRTDTNELWISGVMEFKYGLLDSCGQSSELLINVNQETVVVQLQSIVNVSGTPSSFQIVEYTNFESSGLPAAPAQGYTAILRFTDEAYTDTIDGVDYWNNKIIHWNGTAWISWSGDYPTS